MSSKHLDDQSIQILHAAAIHAGLAAHRADLLRGIDPAVIAGLPSSPTPSAQLLTDLHELCVTLQDGSVPIAQWLENAVLLAGTKPGAVFFEDALRRLGRPIPPRAAKVVDRRFESRRRARAIKDATSVAQEAEPAALDRTAKKKVLWVDDDRFALLSMSFWLTDRGYEVIPARSPAEALRALKREGGQIGCAVIDLYLPGASSPIEPPGLKLARSLKKLRPEILLVCLSNVVSTEAVEWFRTHGAGYFHKHELASSRRLFLRAIDKAMTGRPPPPGTLLVHRGAEPLRIELEEYLVGELGWTEVRVLKEIPTSGRTIAQKFGDEAREAELVFVLLTPEDKTFASADARDLLESRTDIDFELGYFLGSSRRRGCKVIVLAAAGATMPIAAAGAVVIELAAGLGAERERLRRELGEWMR